MKVGKEQTLKGIPTGAGEKRSKIIYSQKTQSYILKHLKSIVTTVRTNTVKS